MANPKHDVVKVCFTNGEYKVIEELVLKMEQFYGRTAHITGPPSIEEIDLIDIIKNPSTHGVQFKMNDED